MCSRKRAERGTILKFHQLISCLNMKNGAGVKCEDKNTNEEWIEEALKKRNAHLQKLQLETNIRKISVQAEIDHHEIVVNDTLVF